MSVVPGVHRTQHRHVIHNLGQLRQQFRDFGPALTMFLKHVRTAKQLLAGAIDKAEVHVAAIVGSTQPAQFRLRIEQIHMRGPTMHEQRDHRRRPGRMMRNAGQQIERKILTRL